MTPIALTYLLLGLLALLFPLAVLLFRKNVLVAQWLLSIAILLFALSLILYSCLFNSFLSGEYLLVILFMLFALFTAPVAVLAISHLTRPQGLRRLSRALFILPLAMIILLAASVIIGGPDMYRLWIYRGASFEASYFFPNSWRYNLIVIVHFYLFHIALLIQVLHLTVHSYLSLRRFRRTLAEYYTTSASPAIKQSGNRTIPLAILLIAIPIVITLFLYPFNAPRPLAVVLPLAILQAVAIVVLGLATYRLSYAAENLRQRIDHSPRTSRPRDLAALGRQLSQHIEQQAFRDPDLSVFSLANTFHVSQDQVVDAIHRVHGQPFADYIDSLRIQHAISLLAENHNPSAPPDNHANPHSLNPEDIPYDPDRLIRIAHQCGYPDLPALQRAYRKIMQSDLPVDQPL